MIAVLAVSAALLLQQDTSMQHMHMQHDTMHHDTMQMDMQHDMNGMNSQMLMARMGDFSAMAMPQAFPTYTTFAPRTHGTALDNSGVYITQPAVMANISNHDASVVLRATLNFESWTQPHGELTAGAWGEGYIDKRHPHTLLHELTVSWNRGSARKGFSVSAGKGFAPYGTDDPMSRPVLKYPTNHHLSQVLERWFVSGVFAYRTWGLEAGTFSGDEPNGPDDLSNYHHFGNSWSARLTRRLGSDEMARWPLEISASYADVKEYHHSIGQRIRLENVAVRHEKDHGSVRLYVLAEASHSKPQDDDAYFSILAESALRWHAHQPYARFELSTRPEYARLGNATSDAVFRYDHDAAPIGASRWLTFTGGYGYTALNRRISPRPYIEAQYNHATLERGILDPASIFGRSGFGSISPGVRIFLGGDPMRMGTYGVLDPMRAMHSH